MQKTIVALSIFAALIFVSVPFAAAEWQENMVTNNTLEEIYVIKSTWQAANSNKGIPAGFWTRGSYRLDPGKSRVFYSWDTNNIYFRISNADGAIKANSGTTASAFWSHPKRSFRVVSQTLDTSVTTDQLLYSDRPNNQLVQLEGFVSYTGGSAVVVTPEWVSLDGQPTAPPNDELGDDGGRPGEDVAPPAWVASVITNATEADLYVVYATWKLENSKKGYPEGFRTRGTYRIRPGKGRVFHAWADNEIYFRIANAAGALKPEASSETFGFWLHPRRSFRLVSDQVSATVEQSGLSYSDRSNLVQSDGFMVYESGSDVTVTADWVPVAPIDDSDDGKGNAGDDGTPLPPETPTPPVNPPAPAGMVLIPAGTFQMGSTTGDADERPVHAVSLDAFYMDTHEVTNAEYAAFLNAKGKHADADHKWLALGSSDARIERIDGRYSVKAGYENHPVVRVTWYGAMAYAAWAGKRLPTEAEWEYAARGGLAGKQYPWGDTIDTTQANYGWNIADTTAGGAYAANGYGLYDMAGNVFEWCLDTYLDNFYDTSPAQNPLSGDSTVIDTYTTVDSQRVLRGGSWFYSASVVRVSNRDYSFPMSTGNDLGFRCVKSVSTASFTTTRGSETPDITSGNPDTTPVPDQSDAPAGMALIPAGTFQMGSNTGDTDERPVHTVTLDAFYMDTHEVTNTEYAAFLNAMGKHINGWWRWVDINGGAYTTINLVDGVYRPRAGYENHPVISVRWRGAMAYARWAGKRLPTEAEWEYAARGGLAGKRYPWGDTLDKTKANYNNPRGSTAVGSYPPNGYGLYDMVGNVAEWCLDAYDADYYAKSPTHNPVSLSIATSIQDLLDNYNANLDIFSPSNKYGQPQNRVVRGGDWSYRGFSVTSRYGYSTWGGATVFGFRCVKPVAP